MSLMKCLALRFAACLLHNHESKVVFYHDLHEECANTTGGTSIDTLRRHVRITQKLGYRFASTIMDLHSPQKLLMTFDDGFHGLWSFRDYFIEEGLQPTVFIAPELVGREGFLSWDEISELHRLGFHFESHTYSHRPLVDERNSLSEDDLKHELIDSKHIIEDVIQTAVEQICFPRGYFSERVVDKCRECGYKFLFSSIPGSVKTRVCCAVMPRNNVERLSDGDYAAVINGGMIPYRNRFLRKHYFTERGDGK